MADTTQLMARDIDSIKIEDYTSGTRLFYEPNLETGEVSWTNHHPAPVMLRDQNGKVIAVRDGSEEELSTLTLSNATLFDVGKHGTDVTLSDIVSQTGVVGSTWVTASGTGADGSTVIPATNSGERKRFRAVIVVKNRAGSAIKGGTYVWDSVDVEPGAVYNVDRGGWRIASLTFASTQQAPFMTRTT